MVDSYKKRRDIAVDILKANDLFVYTPKGTIYMLIDISSSGIRSYDFALSLLHERRVAVSPGDTFGTSGNSYIRICFAAEEGQLREGLDRICIHIKKPQMR